MTRREIPDPDAVSTESDHSPSDGGTPSPPAGQDVERQVRRDRVLDAFVAWRRMERPPRRRLS